MVKRSHVRRLMVVYLLIVLIALALGCSLKEEPPEVLVLCGNHSCGDLVMITNDTSAKGWQYLNPVLSPDGTQVAFTADSPMERRMVLVMPMPTDPWTDDILFRPPVDSLPMLGAQRIKLSAFHSWVGGRRVSVSNAHQNDLGEPFWVDETTLLMVARFSNRDRMLLVDVSNPNASIARVVFYEPDDLVEGEGWIYYHSSPALSPSPDRRWLLFSRFGCDREPNAYQPGWPENVVCTKQSLWVLDMETIVTENIESPADFAGVRAFQLTSEAAQLLDPAWSPDGQLICFSATTDLIGLSGSMTTELFSIRFDPAAAALGEEAVTRDLNLRRLTTTSLLEGDPIVGLHNYAPTFNATGSEIYFTSTRRAPATTLRARSIWRIPFDGRLEPQILFYSRRDDIQPTLFPGKEWILFSSRLGFPTYFLDWLEQSIVDDLRITHPSMSEYEIYRQAKDTRRTLAFYENVMSHLYLFRGF